VMDWDPVQGAEVAEVVETGIKRQH